MSFIISVIPVFYFDQSSAHLLMLCWVKVTNPFVLTISLSDILTDGKMHRENNLAPTVTVSFYVQNDCVCKTILCAWKSVHAKILNLWSPVLEPSLPILASSLLKQIKNQVLAGFAGFIAKITKP